MDHLEVLREKVSRLRDEISHIQELNQEYRRHANQRDTQAQIAHGQRHERLQAIQQELARVGDLGRRVVSVDAIREKNRNRIHLVDQAKAS